MEMKKPGPVRRVLSRLVSPLGKNPFIQSIIPNGKVLDIGCGNDSPYIVKTLRPDLHYVGIDVGIYNQTTECNAYADRLLIVAPDEFHAKIAEFSNEFDAVICSHNLEHCNDYLATTAAMISALKTAGKIYISFPCAASVHFPTRKNCLNFYDDPSHVNLIQYTAYLAVLQDLGVDVLFATPRYRPAALFLIGLMCEPFCRLLNKQAPAGGTWALYGFETIIVGQKK